MGTPELISPRSPVSPPPAGWPAATSAARSAGSSPRGPRPYARPPPTGAATANRPSSSCSPPPRPPTGTPTSSRPPTPRAPACTADDDVLADVSQTVTPQGLIGVCRFLDTPFQEILAAKPTLVAVLANVRDPGNAGTVLRCADAAGADAVILTDASVDLYNPKSVRASVGSLYHLPVAVGVPVEQAVQGLRDAGVRILAADGAGADDLDDELDAGTMGTPTAWVFGNEAWGLPEETRALADAVVRVPIHGKAESLNLATAAAVCLYASARAQRPRRAPHA